MKQVQLIQACINGDRHSQSLLYEQFSPKMYGVCLRYAKNREEAEDIMQEGFIQVFTSLKSFRYAGLFAGWIRKVMVNTAIQHYRAKPKIRMHEIVDFGDGIAEQMINEDAIGALCQKELLKMIQVLPPACRMVFKLYVFEGMKHKEIAAHLGISEGTSKSNFFDAKLILQKAVTNSLQIAKNY